MARSKEEIVKELAGVMPEDQREAFVQAVLSGANAAEQADIAIGLLGVAGEK